MTEVLLLRHGKSNHHLGLPDIECPLTDRGKRDAQRVGEFLRIEKLVPDQVISSPATRALSTAEKCVKAAGLTADHIQEDARVYEANAADLLEVIESHRQYSHRLLIVGHNPGMEMLVETLSGKQPFGTRGMTTANLAHLRLVDHNPSVRAELVSTTRPRDLPRDFRFEGVSPPVAT